MTLEEEKKLVINWMNWSVSSEGLIGIEADYGISFHINDYKPESERKWWPEIWKQLTEKNLVLQYVDYLGDILYKDDKRRLFTNWVFHTATTEVSWEALIKTLAEKYK